MFNFNSPVVFYLPEIVFTTISLLTITGLQMRKSKNRKVTFKTDTEVHVFNDIPKLYIQIKDVIIDTYSANPKRDPGNIEKMDPIGHSIPSIKKLSNYYTIFFVYDEFEEVWWMREYFGNEILKNLKTIPKKDGIYISTKPQVDFSGEFIRFGNDLWWPKITEILVKKINER